jgi:hypothetical protein
MKCNIEKITGDNRRPGMLEKGFLVRYRPHKDFGWTGCRSFETLQEAEDFTGTLTLDGDLPIISEERQS